MEIKNAIIKDTFLGVEDHGFFTFILHLDYGGSGQAAGLFLLDSTHEKYKLTTTGLFVTPLLREIFNISGVDCWEDLKGKHIRVKSDNEKVVSIGHVLNDKWINFREFINEYKRLESEEQ